MSKKDYTIQKENIEFLNKDFVDNNSDSYIGFVSNMAFPVLQPNDTGNINISLGISNKDKYDETNSNLIKNTITKYEEKSKQLEQGLNEKFGASKTSELKLFFDTKNDKAFLINDGKKIELSDKPFEKMGKSDFLDLINKIDSSLEKNENVEKTANNLDDNLFTKSNEELLAFGEKMGFDVKSVVNDPENKTLSFETKDNDKIDFKIEGNEVCIYENNEKINSCDYNILKSFDNGNIENEINKQNDNKELKEENKDEKETKNKIINAENKDDDNKDFTIRNYFLKNVTNDYKGTTTKVNSIYFDVDKHFFQTAYTSFNNETGETTVKFSKNGVETKLDPEKLLDVTKQFSDNIDLGADRAIKGMFACIGVKNLETSLRPENYASYKTAIDNIKNSWNNPEAVLPTTQVALNNMLEGSTDFCEDIYASLSKNEQEYLDKVAEYKEKFNINFENPKNTKDYEAILKLKDAYCVGKMGDKMQIVTLNKQETIFNKTFSALYHPLSLPVGIAYFLGRMAFGYKVTVDNPFSGKTEKVRVHITPAEYVRLHPVFFNPHQVKSIENYRRDFLHSKAMENLASEAEKAYEKNAEKKFNEPDSKNLNDKELKNAEKDNKADEKKNKNEEKVKSEKTSINTAEKQQKYKGFCEKQVKIYETNKEILTERLKDLKNDNKKIEKDNKKLFEKIKNEKVKLGKLEKIKTNLEKQISKYETEVKPINDRIKDLESEVKENKDVDIASKTNELNNLNNELDNAKQELKSLKSDLDKAKNELSNFDKENGPKFIEKLNGDKTTLSDALSKERYNLQLTKNEISNCKDDIKKYEKTIKSNNTRIEKNNSEIKLYEKSIGEIDNKIEALKSELNDIMSKVNDGAITDLPDDFTKTQEKVEKIYNEIENYKNERDSKSNAIKDLVSRNIKMDKTIEKNQSFIKEKTEKIKTKELTKTELETKVKGLTESINRIDKQIKEIPEKREQLVKERDNILKNIAGKVEKIKELKNDINKTEKEIKTLNKANDKINKQNTEIGEKIKDLRSVKEGIDKNIDGLTKGLDEVKNYQDSKTETNLDKPADDEKTIQNKEKIEDIENGKTSEKADAKTDNKEGEEKNVAKPNEINEDNKEEIEQKLVQEKTKPEIVSKFESKPENVHTKVNVNENNTLSFSNDKTFISAELNDLGKLNSTLIKVETKDKDDKTYYFGVLTKGGNTNEGIRILYEKGDENNFVEKLTDVLSADSPADVYEALKDNMECDNGELIIVDGNGETIDPETLDTELSINDVDNQIDNIDIDMDNEKNTVNIDLDNNDDDDFED